MNEIAREILPVNLEDEMRQSYLDYAMSVIVGRALPDVRDGLKPVHRRILHAMRELGNDWNKAYKKSARVVGDVIGKYHPHGDNAVYDALVRMAQDFSLRYLLVDGQGNFGSVDGDAPAAMRYTEVRMSRITQRAARGHREGNRRFRRELRRLGDRALGPAGALPEPAGQWLRRHRGGHGHQHPAAQSHGDRQRLPRGAGRSRGHAGRAHAARAGPGFPDRRHHQRRDRRSPPLIAPAAAASRSARKTHFEDIEKGGRQAIVVTELPFQVNKARLIERIADLVREKQIDGIASDGLRDESDKDGMRLVIELKRGEVAEVLLNNLSRRRRSKPCSASTWSRCIDGQPKLLGLKEMLEAFLRHRREIVTRRTIFDLAKARDRAHVLEGLAVALANIDDVIALIKSSPTSLEAKAGLVARGMESGAVPALLARAGDISTRPAGPRRGIRRHGRRPPRLQALRDPGPGHPRHAPASPHGLEQDKIVAEYQELLTLIVDLTDILARPERLTQVIREELVAIRDQYGDARRTEINRDHLDLSTEDLIEPQDVVVTLSHAGYAKSQPVTEYQTQRRGGRGKAATSVKDEDFIEKLFVANTHDTILCFCNRGKVYW